MKKKLLMLTSILLAASLIFAGCGDSADKSVTEETAFSGFGYESAQKLLDEINAKLASSGISFSSFVLNKENESEDEDGNAVVDLYYESESAGQIKLTLFKLSYGAEQLNVKYKPADSAQKDLTDFDTVVKAVCSVLEGSDSAYTGMDADKFMAGEDGEPDENGEKFSFKSSVFSYFLSNDVTDGYVFSVYPISNTTLSAPEG